MSDTGDKTTPNLAQAFDTVIEWLQLDVPLTQEEVSALKASFALAAEDETALMVVASRTRTVTISERKATCLDIPAGKENKLNRAGKGRVGSCVDRDGFFLFNVVQEADSFAAGQRRMIMGLIFDSAPPDRKLILG